MIKARVDKTGFDRAYKQYVALSKKSVAEIANKTIYEVGKLATTTTISTPKPKIESDLRQSINGNATVASIKVNKERAKKGKKGLFGAPMAKAVESLIKRKMRTAKFVLSGWIAAIKAIAPYVKQKSSPPTGKKANSNLGGGVAAKPIANKATAWIWNSVFGGKGDGTKPAYVTQVEWNGLEKAKQRKAADMVPYINKKLAEIRQGSGFN